MSAQWSTILEDDWLLTSQCHGAGVDEVLDMFGEFLNYICLGCGDACGALRTYYRPTP